MGHQLSPQNKLFYEGVSLDQRVRQNHPLRKTNAMIDFDFAYAAVKDKYGYNGNVSIAPPVLLKIMLLMVFYNVRSERELMETLPERLDWLWFLGLDLDSDVPHHSVLSKARSRWGVEVFQEMFERIVWQCVEAGLVDGKKIFVDSSLIEANASNNSIVDRQSIQRYVRKGYQEFEKRLTEEKESQQENDEGKGQGEANRRYISMTDPDAAIVRHRGVVKPKPRYKTHRGVDGAYEVITSTEITAGSVDEGHRLEALLDQHEKNTERRAETVVGDSKYGTIDNYFLCHERGIRAHTNDLKSTQDHGERRSGIFSRDDFEYDKEKDAYRCPAGQLLDRKKHHPEFNAYYYSAAKKTCDACTLRSRCTTSKRSREIKHHKQQEVLDNMREEAMSFNAKRDLKIRQHLMERSFGQATRYGYKRMRWRRMWRARIQDYLIATIQDIKILIRHGFRTAPAVINKMPGTRCVFGEIAVFIRFFRENILKPSNLPFCFAGA
jgi:transposase